MRSVLLIILAICFTQCKTMNNEISNFKTNKSILEKKFPNSYTAPKPGYNNVFTVANSNYVYQVKLKNNNIVALDTLKSFSDRRAVVSRED